MTRLLCQIQLSKGTKLSKRFNEVMLKDCTSVRYKITTKIWYFELKFLVPG